MEYYNSQCLLYNLVRENNLLKSQINNLNNIIVNNKSSISENTTSELSKDVAKLNNRVENVVKDVEEVKSEVSKLSTLSENVNSIKSSLPKTHSGNVGGSDSTSYILLVPLKNDSTFYQFHGVLLVKDNIDQSVMGQVNINVTSVNGVYGIADFNPIYTEKQNGMKLTLKTCMWNENKYLSVECANGGYRIYEAYSQNINFEPYRLETPFATDIQDVEIQTLTSKITALETRVSDLEGA